MRYIFVYGGLSGAIASGIIVATLAFNLPSHLHSLWFGYLVMLVALSLIFVGVKRYRDIELGGVIRFLPALGIGLGIAVIAGVTYAVIWEAYLASTDYAFMDDYIAAAIRGLETDGLTGAALDQKIAELETVRDQYRNPLFRLMMTFLEIFPVGLLVALVSAALLRNPKLLTAAR